ncbi:MAG: T9SS type A sorting domain-containing protein [Flavobacteriia bacterium]|nr:T9SS type A sorting domain-containing protein [Flavobacteriia bacterium]
MRKIFTTFAIVTASSISFSQVGSTGSDFTVTDINGHSQHLYSILDSGYVVVFDVSATWCGPCWEFHSEHFLEELNAEYGPTGTNKIRVLFYEGDASTGADDLNGTGPNTNGNWVTGVTYPVVNESPVTVNLNNYAPEGYPTINVICPSDKKIMADLFNSLGNDHASSYAAMKGVIDNAVTVCATNNGGGGTNNIQEVTTFQTSLYPNPTTGEINLTLVSNNSGKLTIEVTNIIGQNIYTEEKIITVDENNLHFNFTTFNPGTYFLKVTDIEGKSTVQPFQIK